MCTGSPTSGSPSSSISDPLGPDSPTEPDRPAKHLLGACVLAELDPISDEGPPGSRPVPQPKGAGTSLRAGRDRTPYLDGPGDDHAFAFEFSAPLQIVDLEGLPDAYPAPDLHAARETEVPRDIEPVPGVNRATLILSLDPADLSDPMVFEGEVAARLEDAADLDRTARGRSIEFHHAVRLQAPEAKEASNVEPSPDRDLTAYRPRANRDRPSDLHLLHGRLADFGGTPGIDPFGLEPTLDLHPPPLTPSGNGGRMRSRDGRLPPTGPLGPSLRRGVLDPPLPTPTRTPR